MASDTIKEDIGRRQALALNKVMRTAELPTTAQNMKTPITDTRWTTLDGSSTALVVVVVVALLRRNAVMVSDIPLKPRVNFSKQYFSQPTKASAAYRVI